MTLYANVPGTGSTNYSAYTELNGTSNGLQETGDNDTVDNLMAYFNLKTGAQGVWNGSLVMQDGNGTYQNICTASNGTATNANRTTANTKLANTNGFRVGGTIYYSSGNYNANSNISSWGSIRSMQGQLFDARYSFNVTLTANSLTPYAPIYLVGTINATDGLFYLDQTWWTQTPTATDKVYVLVGGCYDSTTSNCRITLLEHNTWYKYDGSKLVELTNGHTVGIDVPSDAVFTDHTYTVAQGDNNGQIKVTPSSGSSYNVSVKGLNNSAYKDYTTSVTSGSADLVTSGAVYTAIADLPEPMIFKGTLGTGGTITSLPTASASNEGYTYKVITAGTYASQSAKVGDLFVSAKPEGASAYSWVIIPAGDTDSDTWRNIKVNGTEKLGNAISTGAVDFVNGTGTTATFNATGSKVAYNVTYGDAANTACQGNDSRLSDARTPTSHTHGNITNGGALQTNDIAIASGDKLVVTDSSDSNKVARTSTSFDGTTTNTALTPKGTFESFAQHYGDLTPLVTKTYASTSYYASSNSWSQATWYFMSIKPDLWLKPWKIKIKVHTFCPAYSNMESYTWATLSGREGSIIYANWNDRYGMAHSYIVDYPLIQAGFDAGYGHAIGISIYNADNRGSAYYRTFEVELYEYENCTIEFLDTPVKWSDWTGTGTTYYGAIASMNACDRGLQETGDANTTTENRIAYFTAKTGAIGVFKYGLFMEDVNGTYQSICTASDGTVTDSNQTTATTKKANANGFKVGSPIWYSNTGYNANTNISGGSVVYSSISAFDTRYSFNTTRAVGSLTPYTPLYLVGTINSTDGLFYLDQVWWTQTPNATDKIYILVGGVLDSTTSNVRATLYEQNKWFKYDGSKLVDMSIGGEVNQNAFSNVKVGSTTIQADNKTDTLELVAGNNVTLTPDTTNDKVTINATDTTYTSEQEAESGTAVSLVTTGEKYNWNHGIEEPLLHKVYDGNNVYADSTQFATNYWFFMSVKPDIWTETWSMKYKVISYCTDYTQFYTESLVEVIGLRGLDFPFFIRNQNGTADIVDASHSNLVYKNTKEAGFNAGYGHAFGLQVNYSTNVPADPAYYRTIIVDIYECKNCEVTLLDTPVKWADWTGGTTTNYDIANHVRNTSFVGYWSTVAEQISVDDVYSGSYLVPIALASTGTTKVRSSSTFKVHPQDAYMQIAKSHSSTTSVDSGLWCGNSTPDGTPGAVRGILNLFAANGKANFILPAENDDDRLYYLPKIDYSQTLTTTEKALPISIGNTITSLDDLVNLMLKGNGRSYLGTVKIMADIGVGYVNTWVRVLMVSQNAPNNQTYGLGCMALFFPDSSAGHITYAFIGGHTAGNYSVSATGTLWDSGNAHDQNVKRNVDGSSNALYRVLMSYNANDTTDISETSSSFLGYNPALKRLVINHSTSAMLEAPSNQLLYIRASNEANLGLVLGVRKYNNQGMWSFSPEGDGGTYLMRLGMPNYRWNQIYSTSSSISTSDRNEKKDIVPLDESARDFIMALNPVSYKFINGESGRTHYGMIAQDVEEEMAELGMTAQDFAGFCKDQKTVPYQRMEGECIITDDMPVEGEYRYGLRYEEFMAPAIKTIQLLQNQVDTQQQEIDELKQQLAEIKAMLNGGN